MIFDIFVIPMHDDGSSCDCVPEENFAEEETKCCDEKACECKQTGPAPADVSVDSRAFNELFNKYTEANRLITSLQKENESLKQHNRDISTKYRNVSQALKDFERRVSSLYA